MFAGALLSAAALVLIGCPSPEAEPDMAETEVDDEPGLDPLTLFERRVKPLLNSTCSCHVVMQETVAPFLKAGDEYNSITGYAMGKFLTSTATSSLLLSKGAHQGPAWSEEQRPVVQGWLESEIVTRGLGTSSSPTTPTVALKPGVFYINLESLVGDPLAKITFEIIKPSATSYRINNLKLFTGPTASIHIKRPRFVLFTASSATFVDSLATVDMTVPASTMTSMSMTIGIGSVILSNPPASATRLALTFDVIDKPMMTGQLPKCDNIAAFGPVKNVLGGTCAGVCHSPTASDVERRNQASTAFNMTLAKSMAQADIDQICIRAKARLNLATPGDSMLLIQTKPPELGGVQNHFFKLSASEYQMFQPSVTSWAGGEK